MWSRYNYLILPIKQVALFLVVYGISKRTFAFSTRRGVIEKFSNELVQFRLNEQEAYDRPVEKGISRWSRHTMFLNQLRDNMPALVGTDVGLMYAIFAHDHNWDVFDSLQRELCKWWGWEFRRWGGGLAENKKLRCSSKQASNVFGETISKHKSSRFVGEVPSNQSYLVELKRLSWGNEEEERNVVFDQKAVGNNISKLSGYKSIRRWFYKHPVGWGSYKFDFENWSRLKVRDKGRWGLTAGERLLRGGGLPFGGIYKLRNTTIASWLILSCARLFWQPGRMYVNCQYNRKRFRRYLFFPNRMVWKKWMFTHYNRFLQHESVLLPIVRKRWNILVEEGEAETYNKKTKAIVNKKNKTKFCSLLSIKFITKNLFNLSLSSWNNFLKYDSEQLRGVWRLGRQRLENRYFVDYGTYRTFYSYDKCSDFAVRNTGWQSDEGRVDWWGEMLLKVSSHNKKTLGLLGLTNFLLTDVVADLVHLNWLEQFEENGLSCIVSNLFPIWRMWGECRLKTWGPGQRLLSTEVDEVYEKWFHWEFYESNAWRF